MPVFRLVVSVATSTSMVSSVWVVMRSLPSRMAWMAALRISRSNVPIEPPVRWCR